MLRQVGSGKVVQVTGIHRQGRTATILLRGSNKLVLEEAERSLHDALCVIRCLVQKRALIPGGAAPEMEVEHQLIQWAKTLQVPQHSPHLTALAAIRIVHGAGSHVILTSLSNTTLVDVKQAIA